MGGYVAAKRFSTFEIHIDELGNPHMNYLRFNGEFQWSKISEAKTAMENIKSNRQKIIVDFGPNNNSNKTEGKITYIEGIDIKIKWE